MRGPDQRLGQRPSISRPMETNAQYRARMLEQIRRADALKTARNGGENPVRIIESGSITPGEIPLFHPTSPEE
jgi:hypothetical protein